MINFVNTNNNAKRQQKSQWKGIKPVDENVWIVDRWVRPYGNVWNS
ncbi:hypothetical protein [Scytonema hofmannii]|nr:hypothetical protein [Scytonema hofmannii]